MKAVEEYLQINGQQMQRPLHDILQYPLPVGPDIRTKIHLGAWRKLIQTNGRKKVFRYFVDAEKIEAKLFAMDEAEKKKKEQEEKRFPHLLNATAPATILGVSIGTFIAASATVGAVLFVVAAYAYHYYHSGKRTSSGFFSCIPYIRNQGTHGETMHLHKRDHDIALSV